MAAACLLAAGACGGSGSSGRGGGGDGGSGRGGPDGAAGGGGSGGASGGSGGGSATGLESIVAGAPIIGCTTSHPDFGAVSVAHVGDGERVYAVESRRDVEPGPLGLSWRSRFRLAAYDQQDEAAWTFAAPPDDVVSDVAVHPSGDVTIAEAPDPSSAPVGGKRAFRDSSTRARTQTNYRRSKFVAMAAYPKGCRIKIARARAAPAPAPTPPSPHFARRGREQHSGQSVEPTP